MNPETLTTGELARRSGVNVQTLRYYERRRLLKQPPRRPSGYREYPTEAVRLIRFIKHAQQLGFSLSEIEELIRLREDQSSNCADVRSTATAKIEDIDRKLKSLRTMKKALAELVRSCQSDGSARSCPILEALDELEASGGLP